MAKGLKNHLIQEHYSVHTERPNQARSMLFVLLANGLGIYYYTYTDLR